MRPDSIIRTTIGFALTGIDHIHLLHFFVAVPVIVGKIHITIGLLQGLNNHRCRMLVVTIAVVTAIVCLCVGHGIGTYHIKGKQELTIALGFEVVVHRALETAIGEVRLVGNALIEGIVVGRLERNIAEVHQNDESLLCSRDAAYITHFTWC